MRVCAPSISVRGPMICFYSFTFFIVHLDPVILLFRKLCIPVLHYISADKKYMSYSQNTADAITIF